MAVSCTATPSPSLAESSPERLTPRSKIRALLDTVPSSDDDEDGGSPSLKSTAKGPSKLTQRVRGPQLDLSESGEDDEVLRPRGRLASRMQRAEPLTTEPEDAASGDKRTGQKLNGAIPRDDAHSSGSHRPSGDAADTQTRADDEADDDGELPVLPRRKKRRSGGQSPGANIASTTRSPSPGLFVSSPAADSRTIDKDTPSESEDGLPAIKSARFQALVERKRAERLAREKDQEADETTVRVEEKLPSELDRILSEDASDSGITDDEGGHKLTQEARPTRKASRKTIEEIDRETQRMTRNMQLAHEPRTRKKITKENLLERYNFRPLAKANVEPEAHSSSCPTTRPTDADLNGGTTPPSSPPENLVNKEPSDAQKGEPPALVEILNGVKSSGNEKGKAIATVSDVQDSGEPKKSKPRLRVRWPPLSEMVQKSKGSRELEITVTAKDRLNAALNNKIGAQGQESRSLKTLRLLAQVKSPSRSKRGKDDHSNMNAAQLEDWLRQKVRQQAKLEHDRRIEVKKARGIDILTTEERERQEEEVENLVARTREEARDIMMEERAAAKNEQGADDAVDPLAWDDSSEDGEYDGAGSQADGEEEALELSGSEDEVEEEPETGGESGDEENEEDSGEEAEEDEVEQKDEGETCEPEKDAMVSTPSRDASAIRRQRTARDASETDLQDGADEDEAELPVAKQRRERKQTTILSDDEAEVGVTPKAVRTASQSTPAVPKSVLRSASKTFIPGLPVKGPAGLSLTQIFAGTMDDSQARGPADVSQPMLPDFDQLPDSNFSATAEDMGVDLVQQTQSDIATQATEGVQLDMSQSQVHRLDSLMPDLRGTQMSKMVEPTQDCGPRDYTPLRERFIDPTDSTVETLKLDEQSESVIQDSPVVRRGRLRSKMEMLAAEDEPQQETAFDRLIQEGRALAERESKKSFDRRMARAREVVEEQAEESEDEYAGLGGADGEDDDESTASMRELIDDDAENNVDGRQLAAFHADRERADAEKQVEKLFKDMTTGALRRSRAAGFDLSDSDNGGEARRRAKRAKFSRMQKSLFADERVKRMAEDPGNQAFLRTIEDRASDDEMDLLDVTLPPSGPVAAGRQTQIVPDSQPDGRFSSAAAPAGPRAPAHMRRTKMGKKPSNLSEIRETLSSLLDDRRDSIIPATEASSSSSDDGSEPAATKPPQAPPPADLPRRNSAPIDRISLKRKAASSAAPSLRRDARLAFAHPSAAATSSTFQAPTLLRRATTNSTFHGAASSFPSATTDEPAKIKKPAGRSSAVVGMAARPAGPAPLAESERRRERKKWLGAQMRMGAVGALLGKGSFT